MLKAIKILLLIGVVALVPRLSLADQTWPTFDQAKFQAAQAAGKSIVVHSFATWCTTCKAQAPTLGEVARDPKFANVAFFELDIDRDPKAVEALKFTAQAQFKIYKGAKEIAWEVGMVDRDSIYKVLGQAL